MKSLVLFFLQIVVFTFSCFCQNLPGLMLDPSFSKDGRLVTDAVTPGDTGQSDIQGIILENDNSLIAAGTAINTNYSESHFVLVKYRPDGTIERSFGGNGIIYIDYQPGNNRLVSIKKQSTGKIVAIGYHNANNISTYLLFRFNTDGSLDKGFGDSGWIVLPISPQAIAIQNNDDIIISSENQSYRGDTVVLYKYLKNGRRDTSFGKNGFAMAIAQANNVHPVYGTIAIDKLSRIVVGFTAVVNKQSSDAFVIARFNADGSLDSSFNGTGMAIIDKPGSDYLYAIAIQSNNKIVAGGSTYDASDFLVARLNESGTIDSSFGSNGMVTIDFSTDQNWGTTDYVKSIVIQKDNKIIAAGTSYSVTTANMFALTRLKPNGSLDNSFGFNGRTKTKFKGQDNRLNATVMQPDGKLVCGGYTAKTASDVSDFAIARYLSEKESVDGVLDQEKNETNTLSLSVYPNPADDVIYIKGVKAKTVQVILKDQFGNFIKECLLSSSNNYRLAVSLLYPGIYFLQVNNAGQLFFLKFLKK